MDKIGQPNLLFAGVELDAPGSWHNNVRYLFKNMEVYQTMGTSNIMFQIMYTRISFVL